MTFLHEIADSDDEVQFDTRKTQNLVKDVATEDLIVVAACTPGEAERDPLNDIDFGNFYSPTQLLPSYESEHDSIQRHEFEHDSSHLIDSSTNRFLNEIAPLESTNDTIERDPRSSSALAMGGKTASSGNGTHKRTRSQADDKVVSAQDGGSRKKSKMYGSTVNSGRASDAARDFKAMIDGDVLNLSETISIEARTQYTTQPDTSSLFSGSGGQQDARPAAIDQSRSYNQTYQPPLPYTPGGSLNNLQGGNTNWSSMGNYQSYTMDRSALGANFNDINPFGRASQVSVTAEDDTGDGDALAKIFKGKNSATHSNLGPVASEVALEMQTSPVEVNPTITPEELTVQPTLPSASPPFSPITNPDDNPNIEGLLDEQELNNMIEDPAHTKKQSKKRGRKPKAKTNDVTALESQDEVDELQLEDKFSVRRVRAGTVDSISNVSEISQATSVTKSGKMQRGRKKLDLPPDVPSKKLPSSDLGLDSKAVIGLSPERYKPRPSRRRGRADPEPEPELVSLPHESDIEDKEILPAAAAKGKKVKKGRGKQGKITVEESKLVDHTDLEIIVLDEEDDQPKESEYVESIPVQDKSQTEGADDDDPVSRGRHANITIDIPALPTPEDGEDAVAIPEPKKRGRKRKKPIEIAVEASVTAEEPLDECPALQEQDSNIPPKKSKSKSKATLELVLDEAEGGGVVKHEDEPLPGTKSIELVTPIKTAPNTTTPIIKTCHSDYRPLLSTPSFSASSKGRVGLSKRHSIPSLLRKIDRNKEAPKAIERKEKLNKRQLEEKEVERIAKEEAEAEGRDYVPLNQMRGKDGRLIEWDF